MVLACVDIGTNTTRLLVAETGPDGPVELLVQRVFTRIGRATAADGTIAPDKVGEVCDVVAAQARAARSLGAVAVRVVATACVRDAPNRDAFAHAVGAAADVTVEILTGDEEARLAFAGATHGLDGPPDEATGVVDVGGGSTELAVGTRAAGVRWSTSLRVGSGTLADTHLRGDPPAPAELAAVRAHAGAAFADVTPPAPARAVAVGGSATSLGRLAGPRLDGAALRTACERLLAAPAAVVAREHDLDPERVRLLPAGLALLDEAAAAFGVPLAVAEGGLREGVILSEMEGAHGEGG